MQLINRFARYWDMIGNSGRFKHTLTSLLIDNPFEEFMAICNWLFEETGQTHKINLKRLYELVSQSVQALFPEKHEMILPKIELDYNGSGLKSIFTTLNLYAGQNKKTTNKPSKLLQRQKQHMQ
jgi:hypothetical protein